MPEKFSMDKNCIHSMSREMDRTLSGFFTGPASNPVPRFQELLVQPPFSTSG